MVTRKSRFLLGAATLVVVVALLLTWVWRGTPGQPDSSARGEPAFRAKPGRVIAREQPSYRVAEMAPNGVSLHPGAMELAAALNAGESTAHGDLEILARLFAIYRQANQGDNPVGSFNEEVTDRLRGRNLMRLSVLPPSAPLNAAGELLDRWGIPYMMHPASRTLMELRSAGPDKQMWTGDDLQWPDQAER